MSWEDWLKLNAQKIEHVADFERKFVLSILTKIPEISPEDVHAQFYFKDSKGGNRYIDFVILNKSKGYRLPIELDGLWKVENYNDFNDMLERQNDIISDYGILLRFTNKKMHNEPQNIIEEIRKVLKLQSSNQLSQKVAEEKMKKDLDELRSELIKEKEKLERSNHSDKSSKEINNLRLQIDELKSIVQNGQSKRKPNNSGDDISDIKHTIIGLTKELKEGHVNSQSIDDKLLEHKVQVQKLILLAAVGFIVAGLLIFKFSSGKSNSSTNEHLAAQNPSTNSEDLFTENKPSNDNSEQASASSTNELETEETYNRSYEDAVSQKIPAQKAYQHVGDFGVVCGNIAQIKDFNKGKYLNLGANYPNQDATIVVWESDLSKFSNLYDYNRADICIRGTISSYKGTPQIKLSDPSQIQ